jgi:hypothetical protein
VGMPLLPLLRFRKLRGVVGVEDSCMELEAVEVLYCGQELKTTLSIFT